MVAVTSRMEESPEPAASIGELVTTFIKDVTGTVYRYYLILDGIDRVTSLAPFLANLNSSRRKIPKIIVLSHPEPEIINILNKYPMINMTRDQVDGDIKCVLPSYINGLIAARHPNDRRKIGDTFMNNHNGSFLHAISCIPINIFDLYALFFDRLIQDPNAFKWNTAVRSLRWIAIAQ
jgi:hypothetical protein